MFQFPFGTMHQLNLDWFLQQWQQLRQEWIDEEQHIEDSMQDIYDARDIAVAAKDDAVSAKNDAETAKTAADADALIAEGFAVGEQNGSPVGPGSPYYQVNAKFYSTNAGTYRYLSEAYARGTMGGTPVDPGDAGYEDNAKYYKDAADLDAQSASDDAAFAAADALKAEGYAVGEQNGTPVSSGDPYYHDNAKYYAAEAQQDKEDADTFKAAAQTAALKSEGWAVGEQNGTPVASGSPYYENNAEYYKDLAASVVLGADGAAAQAMIAGEEMSTTVTADYPSGSYIRVQGVLYKTTNDLKTGDTLTVGTNCLVAVIGDSIFDIERGYAYSEENITFITGAYINLSSSPATLTPVANAGSKYAILSCRPGDIFDVSLKTYSSARAWAFVDKDNNIISREVGTTGLLISKKIIAPPSTVLVVFNDDYPSSGYAKKNLGPSYGLYGDLFTFIYNIIADVLPDMVAESQLTAKDLVIVNSELYQITATIASGAALTPGTNCTKTKLSTIIKNLL